MRKSCGCEYGACFCGEPIKSASEEALDSINRSMLCVKRLVKSKDREIKNLKNIIKDLEEERAKNWSMVNAALLCKHEDEIKELKALASKKVNTLKVANSFCEYASKANRGTKKELFRVLSLFWSIYNELDEEEIVPVLNNIIKQVEKGDRG